MANYIIGKKRFTNKEIKKFAKISNDYNPIHLDPTAARRLIAGNQVVHGINLMLTALNFSYKKLKTLKFNKIKCVFINPVNVPFPSLQKVRGVFLPSAMGNELAAPGCIQSTGPNIT